MKNKIKLMIWSTVILITLLISNVCSSEKVTVTATGFHLVEEGETLEQAQEKAYNNALRHAIEQVGIRIASYSIVINNMIKHDEIETAASAIVQITAKSYEPVIQEKRIKIIAKVTAVVDTADLDNYEPPDIEHRKRLEKRNDELTAEISRIRKESLIRSIGNSGGSTADITVKVLEKVEPLLRQGQFDAADDILSDAIKGGVRHAELYYQRGWCNMAKRQFAAAKEDFNEAVKISADSKYIKARGDAWFKMGKYDFAMQDYNRVISTNPGDSSSWANRGACYWALDNSKQAIKNYDMAMSLGNDTAARIRQTLNGQYDKVNFEIKKTARKILPLC